MLTVSDLRRSFLNFFKDKGHTIVPSSSLVPRDDPTLLFTTAGMVQFKPMFAGTVKLDYTKAATVQKCLRTSDLENVGNTRRHCTFFEMLGNFSFGDYFKKEAIRYAWDYSVDIIGFPKEDIWISVYEEDNEAFDIWNKDMGIPSEKIVHLGREDNFWGPAGDSGACGPCSELYLDRGPGFGCGSKDCRPGCDCERFLEYWNLVFNQFFQNEKGELSPLPRTGIDTGMGLERLATLVQDVDSIYMVDELYKFVQFVCKEAKIEYKDGNITPVNVLVEHARALTFAISDGAYPSNEGRGYVLRRILRRALRFGRQLGIHEPFVYRLVDPIVETMGYFYPEIATGAKNVKLVLEGEEKRFLETLENGMDRLEEIMKSLDKSGKTISGREAFVLYDTYGFPLEMTVEIAGEKDLLVDIEGFNAEMEKQRERGKQSWKSSDAAQERFVNEIVNEGGKTDFKGYESDSAESQINALGAGYNFTEKLSSGEEGFIITFATAFYGESGGQVGDTGRIISENAVFNVTDTQKYDGTIVHFGRVVQGEFKKNDKVKTEIDSLRRNLIRANHTATHLLQASLRQILGEHVHQAGSFVEPERFRFDFSHFTALTPEELQRIEHMVNEKIWEARPVETVERDLKSAVSSGALAVFDEKYGDTVRVVSVKDFSMELCGGTHVDNTGKIGIFKILKEASPGAGMRRIEAVTLKGIYDRFNVQSSILSRIESELDVAEHDLPRRVADLVERSDSLEKEIRKYKSERISSNMDSLIKDAINAGGVKIIVKEFEDASADDLRKMSDMVRSREKVSLTCFGSNTDGKALLLFAATKTAVAKGIDCGSIIKEASRILGGSGGGRKDMAQAGGKSPELLSKALDEAVRMAKISITK